MKHKAKGALHQYADPSKIPLEEGAFERAVVESYKVMRTPGALANDEFYMAPDFDTCFDDDPVGCGMEEYQ